MRVLRLSTIVLLSLFALKGVAHADEERDQAEAQEKPAKTTTHALLDGGASEATLFGIRSTAVHAGVALGVEHRRLFVPLLLDVEVGKTPGGLGMGEVTFGVGFMGIAGALRIGGGFDVGTAWITRTTQSGHIGAWAIDAFALATVDLFALNEHSAVYIGVKPSAGVRWGESIFAVGHGTLAFRGAALAGVRF